MAKKWKPAVTHGMTDGYQYKIVWDVVHGRLEPVEFTITAPKGEAVTRDMLREFPLGRVVKEGRIQQSKVHLSAATRETDRDDKAHFFRHAATAGGLEAVAAIYREAYRNGHSTTQAVADALGVSPSTAKKKVIAARKAGHLEPARPGKAGEQ